LKKIAKIEMPHDLNLISFHILADLK
jgi:hypothetical protein